MFVAAGEAAVVHLLPFLVFLEGEDRPEPGGAGGGAGSCCSGQVRQERLRVRAEYIIIA